MASANSITNSDEIAVVGLTEIIDELHNLEALVGATRHASSDLATGEWNAGLIDRIDRLMLLAEGRIQDLIKRAEVSELSAFSRA